MNTFDVGDILLDRYQIEGKLGEGGMAVVYRALDLQRRTPMALKLLKPDFAEDADFLRRFKREAQNLKRLDHDNIVRLFEFNVERDLAFMVLQYIDGSTLRKVAIDLQRPMTPGEMLGYLRWIGAALGYAHSLGIVHCDIKPANVMVDSFGKVFINDFGIARLSESATVTFSAPGTALYMAPEQWRGGEDVGAYTDIYALGIMMTELLSGQRVFAGDTAPVRGHNRERIMWEHLHRDPPPLSQLAPAIGTALDGVISRCLSKSVSDRYGSVRDLVNDFSAACAAAGYTEVPVARANALPLRSVAPAERTSTGTGSGMVPPSGPPPMETATGRRPNSAGLMVVGIGAVATVAVMWALLSGRPERGSGASFVSPTTSLTTEAAAATQPSGALPATATPRAATRVPASPTPEPTRTPEPPPTLVPTPESWRLAFSSDRSGRDAIWVFSGLNSANADSPPQSPEQWSAPANGLGDWHPEWCFDNTQILFERGEHLTHDPQYQQVHSLSVGSQPGSESEWAPAVPGTAQTGIVSCAAASDKVLYVSLAQTGAKWLPTLIDGSQRMTLGTGQMTAGVTLNRSGTWAAFSQRTDDGTFRLTKVNLTNPATLYSIHPASIRTMTTMAWSPDETQIAVIGDPGGSYGMSVCLVTDDGETVSGFSPQTIKINGSQRDSIPSAGGHPSWSPDGRWLAYAANTDGDWDIYLLDRSHPGQGPINITNGLVGTSGGPSNEFSPAWSK